MIPRCRDLSSTDVLLLQDMELIEVLWKQDVDMGFTMDPTVPEAVAQQPIKPSCDSELKDSGCSQDDKVGG